jgi:Ca2+-binding RTX toxin-like protein
MVLVYAGYIGGASDDFATNVAVNSTGDAALAGATDSTETTFPVMGSPVMSYGGMRDGFVAKVESVGVCLGSPVTLLGTEGNDSLTGSTGVDVVSALGGRDVIKTLGGNDLICAGDGKDTANGGSGKDKIRGDKGKDRLNGGGGRDTLNGGKGRDTCIGGSGKDKPRKCEKEKKIP